MNTPSFHEKVMSSIHKFIVARVPRRCGKTTLVSKWAVKQQRTTLILVPHRAQADLINRMMIFELGPQNIERAEHNVIRTLDGRVYQILSTRGADERLLRGIRFDSIAVDEFGHIDKKWYDEIGYMKANHPDVNVFMITSSITEGSIAEAIEEINPAVHYISYSIQDAADEGVLYAEDVQDIYGTSSYQNEFGPWDGFWGEISNSEYTHLLKNDWYV